MARRHRALPPRPRKLSFGVAAALFKRNTGKNNRKRNVFSKRAQKPHFFRFQLQAHTRRVRRHPFTRRASQAASAATGLAVTAPDQARAARRPAITPYGGGLGRLRRAQQAQPHLTGAVTTVPAVAAAAAAGAALASRVSTTTAAPLGPPPPGRRALKPGPRLHLHRVGLGVRGGR